MRLSKSFTLERSLVSYVQRTRGGRSRSERVNELLKKAILQEQYETLEEEAAGFFSTRSEAERAEARAFQRASIKSITETEAVNRTPPSGWFPRRGEVYWGKLDKDRPAIVIPTDALNRRAWDVCVVPITTAEHKRVTES